MRPGITSTPTREGLATSASLKVLNIMNHRFICWRISGISESNIKGVTASTFFKRLNISSTYMLNNIRIIRLQL
ncbi:uncharacterized protein Dmoj_GI26803, isoform B [Drosophila mojavensis]|uniref:Uncharacterized protein, isoform B n=1 Tax=Drosophila mojavensis TaxID=7230 RepID=A0A0Q9XMF2_DROMO|nr:uncharacterized protein Dmoj_GI26803, isoform B [Drosophila mojavensis]